MSAYRIIQRTCEAYRIQPDDLRSPRRGIVSDARAIMSWALVKHAGLTRYQAAHRIWGRHDMHSCVIGGIERIEKGLLDKRARELGYESAVALAESVAGVNETEPVLYDRYLRRIRIPSTVIKPAVYA
ncbi:MAG: hypothetical protein ACX94C_07575 [Phycisphaerales bacterium]